MQKKKNGAIQKNGKKDDKRIKFFKLEKGVSSLCHGIIENPYNTFTIPTFEGTRVVQAGFYICKTGPFYDVVSESLIQQI